MVFACLTSWHPALLTVHPSLQPHPLPSPASTPPHYHTLSFCSMQQLPVISPPPGHPLHLIQDRSTIVLGHAQALSTQRAFVQLRPISRGQAGGDCASHKRSSSAASRQRSRCGGDSGPGQRVETCCCGALRGGHSPPADTIRLDLPRPTYRPTC